MTTLRIATAQFELQREATTNQFIDHLTRVAEQAAAARAEVLVLPELVTTGLLATHPDADTLGVHDLDAAYRQVFPAFTETFRDAAEHLSVQHHLVLVAGSHYRRAPDGSFRNTAYIAQPDGSMLLQDKLHLTPSERTMGTTPGDNVSTFKVGPFTAAVQICADIEFPEIARHLANEGVDLILVPSLTWNRRGAQRVRFGAHARAMENQLYVAVSTLVGSNGLPTDKPMHATGNALVTQPLDREFASNDGVLAAHDDDRQEGLAIAELDRSLLLTARDQPEPPGLKWTRPDLYAALSTRRAQ